MHYDTSVELLATRKKQMVVSLLDQLCQQIEVTETQYLTATSRYEAVGSWLAGANSPHLSQAQIYPQGSIALGTTIKPIGRNEFDVDLVCHLPKLDTTSNAHTVKMLIGTRLKEHATYRGMIEEKKRCWRINYANEFHLDITPSIGNPLCHQGGELVPDKTLAQWKPTNPKGYISKFEQYAAIKPRLHFTKAALSFDEARADADIAPLPEQAMTKPLLKRIVQLLKRHRDHMFVGTSRSDIAPISVIISTLAGWAYARCATQQIHMDAFDLISAVIREMPTFIKIETRLEKRFFIIENETTSGENFADKWNSDTRLASSFYDWHKDALASFESLLLIEGVDKYAESLSHKFGATKEQVRDTLASISDPISNARTAGSLIVAPALGLVTAPAFGSVSVPKNTFFGR
jgi:hypothetical protein